MVVSPNDPTFDGERPFTLFRFEVEIVVPDLSNRVCNAAFSECSGLEQTMQHKTIREGGNNLTAIHLNGPVSYGQLSLKRGMTSTLDLWDWFDKVNSSGSRGIRAAAVVSMMDSDRTREQANLRFVLEGCLPVKLKAPAFNAMTGGIAIEEMAIAYERMRLERQER